MKIDFKPTKKISFTPQEKKREISFTPAKKVSFAPDINFQPISFKEIKIGREDTSFAKMSKFQKVLDIVGRPGYAVKSLLAQVQQENIETQKGIPEGDTLARLKAQSEQKPQIKNRLESLWKGFSGEERHKMNELWKNVGVEGVPFLGFATEVGTDPLMYGGYKAITRGIGAVVKPVVKGVAKIPGVTKAVTFTTEKVRPVTSALKEMFITKTGLGKLNDIIEKHLGQREYLKGKEIKFGIKTRNVIQNISKRTGQTIDDIEKQIVSLIEQPQTTLPGVDFATKATANTIKSHLSSILTKEMKAGVPITSLSGGSRNIQYFPRITSKEAMQYLKQARVGNKKIWNPRLANSLKRKTGDFTLDEFNAFVKANGLESLGGRSIEEFFMKNPAYAVATRGLRSVKAVTSAQFLDDAGKTFGTKVNPGYYEQLPDSVTRLNPSLKNLWFDPEVAGEISRTTTQYINPQQAKIFMRVFDNVQNSWKRWTLAPFPKYHLRNMVGNLWNNYLADVNPKNYTKAQAIQMYRKYKGKGNIMEKTSKAQMNMLGISPEMADDIIMQAEKTGTLGRGWYAADIETAVEKQILQKKGFIERGMAFGSTVENNARLAHFIDRVDKAGMLKQGIAISDDVALNSSMSVKKYLFDYGDLTAFEKQVMKRLMPFYTWTRKNVPLQLENLWTQPQKFAPLAPLLRGRDPQDLLRLKYAKPQLYERLPIELRRDIDTVTYIPLEGLIPAGDLAKLVRPHEMLLELLTPYLRAPIELRMNKSFYFESEVQRYPKETQELLRLDLPVKLKYTLTTVIPQARLLNELNKLVKKNVRKEKLTIGEQAFSQSLSSIYKINIKDLRDRALQRVDSKMDALKQGANWAKRVERPEEYKRIKETYKELQKLMKEIKGH